MAGQNNQQVASYADLGEVRVILGNVRHTYFCFTYMCRKSKYIYLLHAYTRIYYHVYIYISMCVCVIEREREKMYMHVYSNKHTYTHLLLFLSMVMGAVPGAESCHHLQTEVCRGRPGGHPESGQWRHGHSGFDARWRKQK